jgi:hypothetical protein
VEIEADDLEEELAANANDDIERPNAFEDLLPRHFPLFITVKQLLFMIDASLYWAFFCRDKQNKVMQLDNNLTWHNENKGLYMINTAHKNVANYDELLLKYAKELIEGEIDKEMVELVSD